ncbi:MAG: CPBP family intramembrane metalloprotease [Sedimentisphaerales bacterium]|nr:CPBP family intramembrane metalloprotease [Sedimentisphaerales bacterium]
MDSTISTIIYCVWYAGAVIAFVYWLKRSGGFAAALEDAPQRPHRLGLKELGIIFIVWVILKVVPLKAGIEAGTSGFYGLYILTQVLTIGFILLAAKRFFDDGLSGFGLVRGKWLDTVRRGGVIFFVGTGLTLLTLFITMTACSLCGYDTDQQHEVLKTLAEKPDALLRVLMVVMAAVFTPIEEELFFRGMVQSFLVGLFCRPRSVFENLLPGEAVPEKLPGELRSASPRQRWLGIIGASVFFVMLHDAGNWQHWPALFVLAMCLGYAYEKYRNIFIPIIGHALFNGMQLVLTLLTA